MAHLQLMHTKMGKPTSYWGTQFVVNPKSIPYVWQSIDFVSWTMLLKPDCLVVLWGLQYLCTSLVFYPEPFVPLIPPLDGVPPGPTGLNSHWPKPYINSGNDDLLLLSRWFSPPILYTLHHSWTKAILLHKHAKLVQHYLSTTCAPSNCWRARTLEAN